MRSDSFFDGFPTFIACRSDAISMAFTKHLLGLGLGLGLGLPAYLHSVHCYWRPYASYRFCSVFFTTNG